MRTSVLVPLMAVFFGTTACGGSGTGLPALSPAEAAHLHAYDISAMSMQNTLQPGDVVGANDAVQVRRGSIIVFTGPPSWQDAFSPGSAQSKKKFVARVIAVGGDEIKCCDTAGNLLLDGKPLHEPYLFPGSKASEVPFDVTVPAGRAFVMGDHREFAADSRAHANDHDGTIPLTDVIGVVTRVLKPAKRARLIPTHT